MLREKWERLLALLCRNVTDEAWPERARTGRTNEHQSSQAIQPKPTKTNKFLPLQVDKDLAMGSTESRPHMPINLGNNRP